MVARICDHDQCTPGQCHVYTDEEINEAVARKMGWEPPNKQHSLSWIGPKESDNIEPPDYCRDIKAAWEIVEHLSKNHWVMILEQHGLGLPHYAVRFSKIPFSDEMTAHRSANSAPMAICLAFLKFAGERDSRRTLDGLVTSSLRRVSEGPCL